MKMEAYKFLKESCGLFLSQKRTQNICFSFKDWTWTYHWHQSHNKVETNIERVERLEVGEEIQDG